MYCRRQVAEKSCQHEHLKNKGEESTGAMPEFVARAWSFSAMHGLKEPK